MWKRRLLLCGLIALCLFCFALLVLVPPRPVSRENYANIHVGMSEQQVEAILGGPAHEAEKIPFRLDEKTGKRIPTNETYKRWFGDGSTIGISVDENQTVTGVLFLGDEEPVFPRRRELAGALLLAVILALFGHLRMVRPSLLMGLYSLIGGATVPIIAGLVGGGGFGAYLAIGLCMWFACLVACFRPRSAILFVAVFTGTAAAVNYWGRTVSGERGAGDLTVFWGMWAFLMGFSLPALLLGGLVGRSNRSFAERLRQIRGERYGSPPPSSPAELEAADVTIDVKARRA
jgi:hypothetical protein